MKRSLLLTTVVLTAAGTLLTTGCVYRERVVYRQGPGPAPAVAETDTEVVATEAPPAPIVEEETIAPAPGFIWIGGVWFWGGHGWRWEGGHWAHPPRPGAVWIPHRYVYRNGRHVFIRGGWR